MKAEHPSAALIPQLRNLWKEAFGDTDAFLDLFWNLAYDPNRCCCISAQGRVVAALYWLDVSCGAQKYAYLYAVATAKDCRGQGLCRLLMADTAEILKSDGYQGTLLVPQDEGLRLMYRKMGYLDTSPIDQFLCAGADAPIRLKELSREEYASLRASYLPEDRAELCTEALAFLAVLARFYKGDGFVTCVSREPEHLRILEYLGNRDHIPGLIAALDATEATVRAPGTGTPFAMYLPLTGDCAAPSYYPFALD